MFEYVTNERVGVWHSCRGFVSLCVSVTIENTVYGKSDKTRSIVQR